MLQHLDESIELFLRQRAALGVRDIDVAFDPPDREWASSIVRPTINVFLWDIHRSVTRAASGMETVEHDGVVHRRKPAPRVEFRYLITAWTMQHRDEHQLLGTVLRAVLAHGELPREFLTGDLVDVEPLPGIELASAEARGQSDLWSALDGQLKPGLDVAMTLAVDVGLGLEAGPPTEAVEVRTADMEGDRTGSLRRVAGRVEGDDVSGALVRSPHGSTEVNDVGLFLVTAEEGDEIVVETEPPRQTIVPAAGGVLL